MSVAVELGAFRPAPEAEPEWLDVCALEDIVPDCGAAALIGGKQIALVRVDQRHGQGQGQGQGQRQRQTVYALSNYDPFSEAFVIARGIVGDRDGRPKIASPIYKQSFDLGTGACLDDPSVVLPIYPVRVRRGRVEVAVHIGSAR